MIYADTEKVSRIDKRVGLQLPKILNNPAFMPHSRIHSTSNGQVKATAKRTKILTQKNLIGYRKQRQINLNQQIEQQKGNKMDEQKPTATQGGFSLSNPQSEKENTMNTQQQNNQPDYIWAYAGIPNALYTDTIFKFNNGYTVRISDDLEREVRSNNIEVDTWGVAMVFHKDRDMAVAEYHYYDDYNEKDGYGKSSEIWFVDEETGENDPESFEGYNVDILGNPNWKEDLARAMVDYAVSREVETGLNADKEFSGSPEIVSVTRDNYAAANRYEQNAAKNPIFLEKIDNRHQPVMPFDDFVIAAMKDTGDSRDEVVELASEAFRSQYQAASGYLRGVSDGSVMYNAFDIEIDDKTYYATAPLEWAKEQARMDLSDKSWYLENARHSFLYSSLENNQWETAFHQLKAAADDYKQWRNQVCAFFNFRQPEITLQQGEWTQIAQFLGYKQELEALDNARLMIAEFTPQQAFEFLGVYQQYQRYVSLAEHNAEQGVDNTAIDKQIAALEQSLNEKVAQNLPLTDNRQVMFDLFGTQLDLFDEVEKQEQGVSASEKTTERQPENTAQGTTTPENSDRLPENSKLHFHFDEQLFEKIETAKKRGDENFRFEDETNLQNLAYILDENGVGAAVDFEKYVSIPYSITDPLSWKERIICHLVNTNRDTGNLISHYDTYFSIEEDIKDDFYADFSKDNPQLKQQVFKVLTNFLSEKYEYALRLKAEYEKASEKAAERLPENLSLWLKENSFDFESVDSHREVFQKDNLKLAVYNDDGDYTVSLSQFDKNIPVSEIDDKMIEPTRQERIYFFQNTDDLEKLSQYLRAMEQGVSVSATPENGVETQPETVSDSPNSKFLGKEFTIDDDTFASATLIQIKSRKIDKQFTDLGYKTELEIHAIHGNHFARRISEQDFQRLAGKKGYGLFYDTSKREFVAVGGKMGERRLFEMPASQFGKEFETLLTELRNTYNIDGSKIVNSQTESLSDSIETEKQGISVSEKTAERLPETQEQGTTASEISANEVKQDLSGQPEKSIEKIVDDYIRATAHNSTLENYQQIMRNYFLQKIDGNNPFFENRPDKMVRAEWLLSLAQNPKNFITIKNREMPELKVVIIDNQKVDIAPDEIRFFNYLREQQRIGLAEKTPVADKSIKELKAELKAAKDALTAAKKELKGLRDEFDSKRGYSYFNTHTAEVQIIHKQQEVLNCQNQFDNLTLQLKTQTGEITDLEREILTARLSGNINARVDIVRRELKTQKDELRQQYDEMGERIKKGEVYEFEIQSVMQEAVDYYSGSRGMATLYHNSKPLPLTTDREKAIAYLLKEELPRQQFEQFGKPHNRIIHQLNNRLRVRWDINFTTRLGSLETKYLDAIESAENQLMKGSIETATEINLTYDINTPEGEKKVRELFYGSRHDETQAELFERVFAMAQKLGVEVRHALRDSGENKEINKFVLGQYSLAKNSARVKHNGYIKPEQKGEVLLHELVHSVTSRAMLLKEQGHTELLNDAQIKAIDEIERIYQAVIAKAEELGFEKYQEKGGIGIGGDYGLKNSHEFIAELSNPKFREKLKQVAVFDDTVKAMTEVATGVEKTETAYDRLTAALYQIMDNYEPDFGAKYEQAKYGNIKMNDIFRQPEKENQMEQTTQTAEKGGISLDDKNSRHANLFLSATKALLYRDLENAVRWHNHFIEESKEIPVPQSVIDMQTKRIEEYSKKLNEYLYGNERQKYRDMFPEQIEKIKQDFKKMRNSVFPNPQQEHLQNKEVKRDAFGLPETTKTLSLQEQALKDGERLKNTQDKASDCYYELQKQPENPQRQEAYKLAQAEVNAIENELKPKVKQAMKDGKPFVVWYVDNWKEYNDNKPSPIELVVTPKGELQQAMGTLSNPENLAKVRNCILHNQRGEVTLNAEQRSSPERTAEVLRWNFDNFARSIPTQMSVINHPMADKVFSEKEIKDTLNKALASRFEDVRLLAIHSPQMKDKWLQKVAETHPCPITVQEAHKVLEERQALSSLTLSGNLKPENPTAEKGGFSLAENRQAENMEVETVDDMER